MTAAGIIFPKKVMILGLHVEIYWNVLLQYN